MNTKTASSHLSSPGTTRSSSDLEKKGQEYAQYTAILDPWFNNGGKIVGLKRSAAKALETFILESGFEECIFERRSMLGKHGTLSLAQMRKDPERLDTRTINSVLAATRKTAVEMFNEQLGSGNENKIALALENLIAMFERSLELTTDTAAFEKSFRSRPHAEQIQDLATVFLRAIDCDNQRFQESAPQGKV